MLQRFSVKILVALVISTLALAVHGQDDELEWRDEAQKVALGALGKKYSHLVTPDADLHLFRYSTPSVSELKPLANFFH